MRRLWRHLRNAATAVSLLLCIAVVWQWSWSHQRSDMVRYAYWVDRSQTYRSFSILSVNGGIQVGTRTRALGSRPEARPFEMGFFAASMPTRSFNAMNDLLNETNGGILLKLPGLQMRSELDPTGRRQFQLRIATAWLLAATAVLPLMALYRLRYRSPTACQGCGYDLRATPQRCPECGRPAKSA